MNSPPRDQNAENANLRRSWPQVRALDSSDYGTLFFLISAKDFPAVLKREEVIHFSIFIFFFLVARRAKCT